jgi:hypothetical protein
MVNAFKTPVFSDMPDNTTVDTKVQYLSKQQDVES